MKAFVPITTQDRLNWYLEWKGGEFFLHSVKEITKPVSGVVREIGCVFLRCATGDAFRLTLDISRYADKTG